MEKFYLENPSLERKEEIIDFINEFRLYNSEINGTGTLERILDGDTLENVLEQGINMENPEYAKEMGLCPAKTFLLIRENDNKIVGSINIRWNLSKEMLNFGGHIGYSIRPTERRKGYNKINLYLGLIEAKKIGLEKVMLDCDVNNLGSDRTLKALGGFLERTEIDPSDGTLTNVYWFNVQNTLDIYKNIYEPYIVFYKETIKNK